MEIERKYLISSVPFALSSYPCRKIEQGYLSTAPVVRIRRDNNDYILTYKSKGMMIRDSRVVSMVWAASSRVRIPSES